MYQLPHSCGLAEWYSKHRLVHWLAGTSILQEAKKEKEKLKKNKENIVIYNNHIIAVPVVKVSCS